MTIIKEIFWPHIYVIAFFFVCNTLSMYLDTSGWTGFVYEDNYLIFDALYYTIITHTTVGYGDILPKWRYWKMLGAIHSLIVFFLLVNEISEINISGIFRRKKSSENEIPSKIIELRRMDADIFPPNS